MRKVLVFILLLGFDFLFVYGVNYTNEIMFKNNFMIYFKGIPVVPEEKKETPDDVQDEEKVVDTSYDGESFEQIGKKIDKVYADTLLEGYGEFIAKTSIAKGVNPYLIGGIILESTSCKIDCSLIFKQCNNVSGMKGEPGCFGGSYKKYNDVGDAITDLVNDISKRFYTKEMQVPAKMYAEYGKNSTWAFKVNKHMENIKRSK